MTSKNKNKKLFYKICLYAFILYGLAAVINAQEFTSAEEALSALNKMGECKCDTNKRAYKYFTSHQQESIPVIISFTLNNRDRHFVGVRALSKIKDESVLIFFINLVGEELRKKSNEYNEHFYDSEGLIADVISVLGDYGDWRAIPVIKESLNRLNDTHRDIDEEALCKLGEISVGNLFELRSNSKDEMIKIAASNEYGYPAFSIKVFDWIIGKFPEENEIIYQSHLGKISAYINLGKYESVLKECRILKNDFPNCISDLEFSIDHTGYKFEELIKFAKKLPR